ncbi:agamous-like MADS-box protein AGL16 [Phoenix dactylifera]|uniref:Agamous-like MADS-box protein AGL16 n=1 Tax=Phoenix dactylifera TaxID=42345 RepID=A0A8B9AMV7_PHODC|nr:agamous-like MADS-box protein AGL16 [Phoenix dactylifera]
MEIARKRCGKGRRKIAMEPIRNRDALYACFSKRRKGIFKKAGELAVLCGIQAAVITLSPGGKPMSFGHPSADAVIDRYLGAPLGQDLAASDEPPSCLDRKPGVPPGGQFWWVDSIHLLDLGDLETIHTSMETIQRAILRKANVLASARAALAGVLAGIQPLAMMNGSDRDPDLYVPSWGGN